MTDDEKILKFRRKMEKEVYSVLLSQTAPVYPEHAERLMDSTLGYTFVGEYHLGGLRSMEQLLSEHPNIRRVSGRQFQIIPTEEVAEVADLVSKQKKKNPRRPKGRPTTATGHRYGFGGFGVKSPNVYRPTSVMTKSPKKQNPNNYSRPFSAATFSRSFTTNHAGHNPLQQILRPNPPQAQRPLSLVKPSFTQPAGPSVERKSETLKSNVKSSIPSIKEFAENAKQMLLKIHPKSVHLSELTEMYAKEYGTACEPLQLFSKSWKMLGISTFKDWMEVKDCHVTLKPDFARQNANPKLAPAIPPPVSFFPTNQGFRYSPVASTPASPTAPITHKMRGLTVGARQVLKTPEVPPGIRLNSDYPPRAKTAAADLSLGLKNLTLSNHQYNAQNLRDLRNVVKGEAIEGRVLGALNNPSEHPNLKQPKSAMTTSSLGFAGGKSRFDTYRPTSSIKTPSSSEVSSSQPTSLSPPNAAQTRSQGPGTFGRAMTAIKRQEIETPIPRRGDPAPKPLYVANSPTNDLLVVEKAPTAVVRKPAGKFVDNWKELHEVKKMSASPHKKFAMPPMAKGSGMSLPPRTSRSQENRRMFEQALQSGLPESEDDQW